MGRTAGRAVDLDRTVEDGQPALDPAHHLATPLRVATRLGTMSFLNTVTVFGTPHDVTLAELALEMLFPADARTSEIAQAMVCEQDALPARKMAVS